MQGVLVLLKWSDIITQQAIETIELINSFFYKRQYTDFIDKTLVFCAEQLRRQHKVDVFIELIKKCLFCVHNDKQLYDKYYCEIINCLGGVCYYNFNFATANSYYYLAIMASQKKNQWRFYHNIADSLTMSGDFELALQYFKMSIKMLQSPIETDYEEVKRNHLTGRAKLNLINCLIRKKEVDTAKAVFDDIQVDKHINEEDYTLYLSKKVIFEIVDNKCSLYEIQQLKNDLIEKEMYISVLIINEFLIHPEITEEQEEKIILENIKVGKMIPSLDLRRQMQIEIIQFYKRQKNKEGELKHLNALFEIDAMQKYGVHGVLQDIFIQEISVFVGNLRKKNTTITSQKKELEEITYILSHDLKTPLRIISSFSDLAQRKAAKQEYGDMDDFLAHIKQSSKNLHELVEDVNVLHSVEQQRNTFESVDLNIVVNKVIKMLQPYLIEKNAQIQLNGQLPTVQGVASNFFIVFKNLVENGLKYNESKNPTVTISADTNERETQLSFKDNGLGIEEEYYEYIFLYFKRLHNKETYDGTGFGLGICKKIINDLNGTIQVESVIGKGSTFTIHLPLVN